MLWLQLPVYPVALTNRRKKQDLVLSRILTNGTKFVTNYTIEDEQRFLNIFPYYAVHARFLRIASFAKSPAPITASIKRLHFTCGGFRGLPPCHIRHHKAGSCIIRIVAIRQGTLICRVYLTPATHDRTTLQLSMVLSPASRAGFSAFCSSSNGSCTYGHGRKIAAGTI